MKPSIKAQYVIYGDVTINIDQRKVNELPPKKSTWLSALGSIASVLSLFK